VGKTSWRENKNLLGGGYKGQNKRRPSYWGFAYKQNGGKQASFGLKRSEEPTTQNGGVP